jgi:rRNA maturation RNase YbeY
MSFVDHSAVSKLKQKRALSSFIKDKILKTTKKTAKLQYIFMNDEDLLQMNMQYLQHQTYTDIITFDLSESDQQIVGEIYISIDRVKENAQKFSTSYEEELHRVIFHGALHLCGYSDKTKIQKSNMRMLEEKWMKEYAKMK